MKDKEKIKMINLEEISQKDLLEELEWKEGDILEWEYHDYNGLPGLRLHKVGDD